MRWRHADGARMVLDMSGRNTAASGSGQRERVTMALALHTERGITQYDFLPGRTAIDGGPGIARLASRIEELRNDHGVPIEDAGWRNGLKVYCMAIGPRPEPPPRLPGMEIACAPK